MTASSIFRTALAVVAALAAGTALGAGRASAELAQWDQARVTQYAQELEKASDELQRALDAQPTYTTPINQRSYYQASDDIRVMANSAKHLVAELKSGKGRAETYPTFQRIRSLQKNAQEEGRKAMIPEHIMGKATPVGGAIIKLAPYYEEPKASEGPGGQSADEQAD
jgi:hypothetical protein